MNTVYKQYDIVVIGAGPGGLGAAIQAARNGAKVLLVEQHGYLGGNLTLGLPLLGFLDRHGKQVIRGLGQEIVEELQNYETAYGTACTQHFTCPMHNSYTLYDHEIFKFVILRKVQEAGIDVLLHCQVEYANVENRTLKTVTLLGKGYRIEVSAKIFIDGTGDGDVAYMAGASYEKGQKDTGVIQPPTLMFKIAGADISKTIDFVTNDPEQSDLCEDTHIDPGYNADFFRSRPKHIMVALRKLISKLRAEGKMPIDRDTLIYITSVTPGELQLNCTRHLGTDGSDVFSLTKAEIEGYLQIEKFIDCLHQYVPGFENCYITNIYPTMGVRESRRFKGIRTLVGEDLVKGNIPEDTVALGSYIIDIHKGDGSGTIVEKVPVYGLPYGMTVSSEIEGLMFVGRCASMDAVAMSSARVMPILMALGEGAGIGAALAVKKGISPKDVDVQEIRAILRASGAMVSPDD